jgi:TIR domain-containing protein
VVVSYTWDVFISYRRTHNVTGWVRNHLGPVLEGCLEDLMDHPKVFVDDKVEVGSYWPEDLAEKLSTTRYMLAVWSPPYFTSPWCMAEWQTMRAREELLGIPRIGETRGLIYPVVYSDGESFPPEARAVQSRFDLSEYGFPYEQFKRTDAYLEFHAKVQSIAADLASRFSSAPSWQADWPVHRPEPFPLPPAELPRLGAR